MWAIDNRKCSRPLDKVVLARRQPLGLPSSWQARHPNGQQRWTMSATGLSSVALAMWPIHLWASWQQRSQRLNKLRRLNLAHAALVDAGARYVVISVPFAPLCVMYVAPGSPLDYTCRHECTHACLFFLPMEGLATAVKQRSPQACAKAAYNANCTPPHLPMRGLTGHPGIVSPTRFLPAGIHRHDKDAMSQRATP